MAGLAFYAPMKAPTHPVPSGDREMAQGILSALELNPFKLPVDLASELRIYDKDGAIDLQQQLIDQAAREVERLTRMGSTKNWLAWVTYHNYYKAPDLIGPVVSDTLDIPYLIIEASIAPRRQKGPWAEFARRSDAACEAADVIFYITQRDKPALTDAIQTKQLLVHLPPFLNLAADEISPPRLNYGKRLIAVGMHRNDVKLESYRLLKESLAHLKFTDWSLVIVGDGVAHQTVRNMYAEFGDRVHFTGQLGRSELDMQYRDADVFVWPGVDEAFGMVYLEAQAAGLPVVAENRPGVRDVIAHPETLVEPGDPVQFATAIDELLQSIELRQNLGQESHEYIIDNHLREAASTTIAQQIERLTELRIPDANG